MKIEPCPFCGSEVRFDLGDLSARCESCFYTGPTDDNEAAAHNRLSRIVRAAEAWVKEEAIPGNLSKIQDAEDALRGAVNKGGGEW
jgi:hypothetical protein